MDQTRNFGVLPDGREVSCIRLADGALSCEVLTWGATLRSLVVPDRNGKPTDIVLGFDRIEDYIMHDAHFGGTIGRFANRIAGGAFSLCGEDYRLPCNDGDNHLHGGPDGFDRVLWTIERLDRNAVTLFYRSPDGEMGYPGTMDVRVTYALSGGSLSIHYDAVSDRDTLCSLTNHAYWNLAGHDSGNVLRQVLQLDASSYTPTDAALIPTGEIAPVSGTPMDFSVPTPIGARIRQGLTLYKTDVTDGKSIMQITIFNNKYLAEKLEAGEEYLFFGRVGGSLWKKEMNTPLAEKAGNSERIRLDSYAPHHTAFPSAVLRAGERFESTTSCTFGIIGKEFGS